MSGALLLSNSPLVGLFIVYHQLGIEEEMRAPLQGLAAKKLGQKGEGRKWKPPYPPWETERWLRYSVPGKPLDGNEKKVFMAYPLPLSSRY